MKILKEIDDFTLHRDTIVDFARRGDEDKVREILSKTKLRRPAAVVGDDDTANESLSMADERGWTALHWAAEGDGGAYGGSSLTLRRLAVMRALLEYIPQGVKVDARGEYGGTPLMIAVRSGNVEGCRLLLKHGADVNAGDDCGWTPVHWAAGGRRSSPLITSVQGVHRARRPPGPLAASLSTGRAPAVSWWEHELRGRVDGFAPLTDVLRLLLRRPARAADPRRASVGGDTPLHVAAARGQGDALALLLQAGADPAAANAVGETPLHLAVAAGHAAAVAALLAAGAGAHAPDRQGVSPAALCGLRLVRLLKELVQPERAGADEGSPEEARLDRGLAAWLRARGVRGGAVLGPVPDPAAVLAAMHALGCGPAPLPHALPPPAAAVVVAAAAAGRAGASVAADEGVEAAEAEAEARAAAATARGDWLLDDEDRDLLRRRGALLRTLLAPPPSPSPHD
jgi:hypothetical protein